MIGPVGTNVRQRSTGLLGRIIAHWPQTYTFPPSSEVLFADGKSCTVLDNDLEITDPLFRIGLAGALFGLGLIHGFAEPQQGLFYTNTEHHAPERGPVRPNDIGWAAITAVTTTGGPSTYQQL